MIALSKNSFQTLKKLNTGEREYSFFSLPDLEKQGITQLARLPFSIRVLLENMLRNEDGRLVLTDHVMKIAKYNPKAVDKSEIPYMPARVILQDFTGVPAIVDLAAMRDAMKALGGNPDRINPIVRSCPGFSRSP